MLCEMQRGVVGEYVEDHDSNIQQITVHLTACMNSTAWLDDTACALFSRIHEAGATCKGKNKFYYISAPHILC